MSLLNGRGKGRGFTLSLHESLELEKRQREYQRLCVDFAGEVINLLGGIEGNAKTTRKANHELAGCVADAVAGFIMRHS